jgi:hypothetical protein
VQRNAARASTSERRPQIRKLLRPDFDAAEAERAATRDWQLDHRSAARGLTQPECMDAVFEIADLWTPTGAWRVTPCRLAPCCAVPRSAVTAVPRARSG